MLQEKALASEISCALNPRPENGIFEVIIVSELKLSNVKMQVFIADMSDDDAALVKTNFV